MVGGGKVGIEVPVVALAARMTWWAVGGRRSNPFVSFSALCWAATLGRSTSAVCNRVIMSVRTPVRPMWSCGTGLSGLGGVDVCPTLEPDAQALFRAKGESSRNYSWIFDGNGLEEGQDVVAIVCGGGQRLGGGLLRLTWLCRLRVLGLDGDDAIVAIGLVCLACGILFLLPNCDVAGENIQELYRVGLPVEDCSLCQKLRYENSVAQTPVPLLLRARKVAGSGAKEEF